MSRYRGNPEAIRALVRDDQVHRDVYIDQEIFELEMEYLWPNTWVYFGHTSQVPELGDYYAADVAGQPLILVRHSDGEVKVLKNRCPHKGTKLVAAVHGKLQNGFSCPYHAWSFDTDGTLTAIPMRDGYKNTNFECSPAALGMTRVANVHVYRGFVFVRLNEAGPSFHDYFGESLSSIDYLADRSPVGELEITGGTLRYLHNCNWKLYVENLNDAMHPMIAHESSAGTAKKLWEGQPADAPKPMAVEQFVPFVGSYRFMDQMGVRVMRNGHSYTGVNHSIHSAYSAVPEYEEMIVKAFGPERAKDILGTARHNTIYYPNLTIKGAIQSIRVARPLAADRTILESWTFRLKGAPDALLARTVMYTRLINSPFSVVGHDDLHAYRMIQEGLVADGNEWVNLQRNYDPAEIGNPDLTVGALSELSMRNQFRAWARFMTVNMPEARS